jgi:hypothetical protein
LLRLLSSSRLGTLCLFYFIDISDGLPLPSPQCCRTDVAAVVFSSSWIPSSV